MYKTECSTRSTAKITAVIVTHNSPPVLRLVIERLLAQTMPLQKIVVVDSGSDDPDSVRRFGDRSTAINVICRENIGFSAANNLAMQLHTTDTDYFVLVNPDAVLAENWVEQAVAYARSHPDSGIISSPLRGMDKMTMQETATWDSLGIYRKLGRWYDRGQRCDINAVSPPTEPYEPMAICGALMFFPVTTYRAVQMNGMFFDEAFHSYKEDIDVSLRVHALGLKLAMLPQLEAHHCRGWPRRRHESPYRVRKLSARNEIRLAMRHQRILLPLYLLKYLYVATAERIILNLPSNSGARKPSS
jgi:GT2 family glycosyltransferase